MNNDYPFTELCFSFTIMPVTVNSQIRAITFTCLLILTAVPASRFIENGTLNRWNGYIDERLTHSPLRARHGTVWLLVGDAERIRDERTP